MNSPHDIRPDSDGGSGLRSDSGSNERTNERTDGDYPNGCLSGTGSRRTGAYDDSHSSAPESRAADAAGLSETARYFIGQARQRMAEKKLDHCRCGVPRDQCGDHKQRPPATEEDDA